MRPDNADEFAGSDNFSFLPELREMPRTPGNQVVCTGGIGAFDKNVIGRVGRHLKQVGWRNGGWACLNSDKRFGWAGGRALIPKGGLRVPHPCGFCKGGVFLLFQFLFSIFRQLRPQLAGGKVIESADAPREFAGVQVALAGGRPLIPKSGLGGPSLRFCFMQGWGCFSLAYLT